MSNCQYLTLSISAYPVYSYIDELNMRQLVEEPKIFESNNQILNDTKPKPNKFNWVVSKLWYYLNYVIGLCYKR